jgi:hypothetical protein
MSKTEATIKNFETRVSGKGSPKESIWNYVLVGYLWRFKGYDEWHFTTTNPSHIGGMMEYKEVYERK